VLLAHHRDDQCETLLLRLLRGSGLSGLSGMVESRPLGASGSVQLLRPFLSVTRGQLQAYARTRGIVWVEDESNSSIQPARNFLRHEVMPLLESRFPGYRDTLARATVNLRAAREWEIARAVDDLRGADDNGRLDVEYLRHLEYERALSLLRYWIASHEARPPSRRRLEEALRQCVSAKVDAQVSVRLELGWLRRYRNRLYWVRDALNLPTSIDVIWSGQDLLALPEGLGALQFSFGHGLGIRRAALNEGECRVRLARSAMRWKPALNRPSRTLKNVFQEESIPPWERLHLPTLLCADQPVWIAQLGYDCRTSANPDEQSVMVDWIKAWTAGR
jgi:tRNA(Ile)-lysidine synthase